MKKNLTFPILWILSISISYAQETDFYLNKARFNVSPNGYFFNKDNLSTGYYLPEENSESSAFYYASVYCAGINSNLDTNISTVLFNGSNIEPPNDQQYGNKNCISSGPITNDFTDPEYISKYSNSVWTVTKDEIEYHKSNFFHFDYVMPNSILNWPGNGDVSKGESDILAPYEDLNNNGKYDPYLGEYPCILGDQASYLIMNDLKNDRLDFNGIPLGVEIHLMFYQFLWPEEVSQTTFIKAKIINRSLENYTNFKFGIFHDMDLGGAVDDYLGTDSIRRIQYIYNGDLNDEGANGAIGFGNSPPAVGILELDNKLQSTMVFNRAGTGGSVSNINDDPSNYSNFFGYMNNIWKNGQHLTSGETGYNPNYPPTNFMFSGYRNSGWTNTSAGIPSSDQRGILTCGTNQLLEGEMVEFNFAIVYGRPVQAVDIWDAVDAVFSNSDLVQNFYDNMDQSCENSTAFVSNKTLEYNLYPNPANSYFQIEFPGAFDYQIVNMEGKIIQQNKGNYEFAKINVERIPSGIYFVEVSQNQSKSIQKIIIQ